MSNYGNERLDFPMISHLTFDELSSGLDEIRRSPSDKGVLKAIVIRPASNERTSLTRCGISPELGVHGDNWARGCWMSLPDGRPHPDVQVAIMNTRTITLIAQNEDRICRPVSNFRWVRPSLKSQKWLITVAKSSFSDSVPMLSSSSTLISAKGSVFEGFTPESCKQASSVLAM